MNVLCALILGEVFKSPHFYLATGTKKELQFNLMKDDQKIGIETYSYSTLPSKDHELKITIKIGDKISIIADSVYNPGFTWVSKSFDVSLLDNGVEKKAHATADLTSLGAKVDAPYNGARFQHTITPPEDLGLSDASMSWWRGTTPTKGTQITFAYFDLQKIAWQAWTVTYIGDEAVSIAGKSYPSHHIAQRIGDTVTDIYEDDNGDPILIKSDTMTERIFDSSAEATSGT